MDLPTTPATASPTATPATFAGCNALWSAPGTDLRPEASHPACPACASRTPGPQEAMPEPLPVGVGGAVVAGENLLAERHQQAAQSSLAALLVRDAGCDPQPTRNPNRAQRKNFPGRAVSRRRRRFTETYGWRRPRGCSWCSGAPPPSRAPLFRARVVAAPNQAAWHLPER